MIHWNVNPELLRIGHLTIRWYGVFFAAAFVFGFLIMRNIYKAEGALLREADSLLVCMMVGTIVGARLGHCLFYDPMYYLSHPIEIVKIWKGGLASHGGAVGILASLLWYTRRYGVRYLRLLDRIAIPISLGGALIRVGNLTNSEIIGIPTNGRWGVVFERVDGLPRHPVQLYEALAYLAVFVTLLLVYRRYGSSLRDGALIGLFLVLVFSTRFALEFVKMPQASYELCFSIRVGQLLSVPFIVVGSMLVARAFSDSKGNMEAT